MGWFVVVFFIPVNIWASCPLLLIAEQIKVKVSQKLLFRVQLFCLYGLKK